jgi:hypothetical protein
MQALRDEWNEFSLGGRKEIELLELALANDEIFTVLG